MKGRNNVPNKPDHTKRRRFRGFGVTERDIQKGLGFGFQRLPFGVKDLLGKILTLWKEGMVVSL